MTAVTPAVTFAQLLRGAETLAVSGDAEVTGVQYDSRKEKCGDVFVAMRGESTDGNRYIDAAVKAGATAVITDSPDQRPREGIAWAVVPHGRKALAVVSANFYGHPAQKLKLTGVTGTNGKTTTTFLTEAMLRSAGRQCALVGTIEYHVGDRVVPAPHTTPESLELNQLFNEAVQAGATEAVMEVSSHALEQGRVWSLPYDAAVFTNLTRDHLDYHRTMENYFAAKCLLFEGCGAPPPRVSVVNADDGYGRTLAQRLRAAGQQVLTFGLQAGCDITAENISYSHQGTTFAARGPWGTAALNTNLIGEINVYNVLAAATAAHARALTIEQIKSALREFQSVPGRFQRVPGAQPFTVVVDYAHTDDALRNLIRIARGFVEQHRGSVITLFGCGGDRDKTKRPLMGKAAGEGSDFVVLTSDNPRSEDPFAIIADAEVGLTRASARYSTEPDRAKAIELALREAKPGDIVLLAGKGHEKTQTTRAGVFPFDDVEVARRTLERLGYGATAPKGAPAA